MNILVTGATGKIAQHIIPSLVRDGHRVRAMVHSSGKESAVREQGAETVVASFEDRRALNSAFAGAETLLFLTPPHEHAAEWASAGIAAAKQAGVKRIVRISALLAGPDGPSDNNRQHGRTDDEIRHSGIANVILRPHFFMQNLLADAATMKAEGKLYAALGDANLAMIDVRDIADTAKRALIDSTWDGNSYDLTGPTSISFHQIAKELSRLLGREIRYVLVAAAEIAQNVRALGLGEWSAQTFHDYLSAYAAGWGDFTTDSVHEISGQPARSFTQFAEDILVPALKRLEPSSSPEKRAPKGHVSPERDVA